MRQHNCCTKCGYKRLWVIDRILYELDTYGLETKSMSVARTRDRTGLPEMTGKFEALICAPPACGYTEWHAYELYGLKELAKDPKSGVRLINSEPASQGPYG
jgi:hypothetical protein